MTKDGLLINRMAVLSVKEKSISEEADCFPLSSPTWQSFSNGDRVVFSMGRKNAGGAPSLLEPQCWTWTSQGVEATGDESWPDELGKVQCVKVLDVLGGEVTY